MFITEYEDVYTRLKQMIINREIEPGEIINQSQLSNDLGVSRTPLRQALCELQGEGIVGRCSKGWYAQEFGIKEMISVYQIRVLLEGLSCRLAVTKLTSVDVGYLKILMINAYEEFQKGNWKVYHQADVEFHNKIIESADDAILLRTINANKILVTSQLIANSQIPCLSDPEKGVFVLHPDQSFEDHMNIIRAFEQKDGGLAETAMKQHIQHALNNLLVRKVEMF